MGTDVKSVSPEAGVGLVRDVVVKPVAARVLPRQSAKAVPAIRQARRKVLEVNCIANF